VIVGMNHPGLLAEYVAVPAGFAWPAPDTVVLEDLVCTEALTVARAAIRRSGVEPGQRALVVGAGSQGCCCAWRWWRWGCRSRCGSRTWAAWNWPTRSVPRTTSRASSTSCSRPRECRWRCAAGWSGCVVAAPRCSSASARNRSTFPVRTSSTPRHTLRGSLIYDHPVDFRTTVDLLGRGEVSPGKVLQARFPLAQAFASVDSVAGKSWISFD